MTTMMKQLSLATLGAAALGLGTITSADATTLNFSGFTGDIPFGVNSNPQYYPEYQNAFFEGFFTYNETVPSSVVGNTARYNLTAFDMTVTNPFFYPDFMAKVGLTSGSFIEINRSTALSTLQIPYPAPGAAQNVSNSSQNDPRKAGFQLSFNGIFNDPNSPTDERTFVPSTSFLHLFDSQSPPCDPAPPQTVPIRSARVEAVPEPTTMAGMGLFGLGMFIKRRSSKLKQKAN